MKRLNYNYLFGAIALAGAISLSSCSSSEDEAQAEVNPTYDGQSVKTQFAINIGNVGSSGGTRMTAENTQNKDNFLGMDYSWLVSLTTTTDNDGKPTTSNVSGKTSDLGVINVGDITPGTSEYKLFYDVEIPTTTNNFLFYGLGPQGGTSGTDDEKHKSKLAKGVLTKNLVQDGAAINTTTFSLNTIQESSSYSSAKTEMTHILETLANFTCNYHYKVAEDGTISINGSQLTSGVKWSSLTPTLTLGVLFHEFLGEHYTVESGGTYTSDNTYSPLAGSSAAVIGTINTLYDKLKSQYKSDHELLDGSEQSPSKNPNKITRGDMACGLMLAIENMTVSISDNTKAFTKTTDATDGKVTFSWANNLVFPLYLPNGAVQYQWSKPTEETATYTVNYNVDYIGNKTNSDKNYVDVKSIVYPPSLAYFGNTPAKTYSGSVSAWPKTSNLWAKGQQTTSSTENTYWTGWGEKVESTTTTVALRYPVNYGVAELISKFKIVLPSDDTNIKDHNNIEVSIPDEGFKVTGILVGGQRKTADWQFLPVTSSDEVTVYDSFTDIYAKKNTESSEAYTLLFDNYVNGTQNSVNIAVEFENNGKVSFEGYDGMVATGQKFYLVGKLDLSSDNSTIESEPYNADRFPGISTMDETIIKRVFIQDHKTTATFKITSLENAYVNIPDLRTTQMVLGLSVDLTWLNGVSFGDVTIGD